MSTSACQGNTTLPGTAPQRAHLSACDNAQAFEPALTPLAQDGRPLTPAHPDWQDWTFQFKHRIKTLDALKQWVTVTPEEEKAFQAAGKNLPFAVTPYYMQLASGPNASAALRKTIIPRLSEFTTSPEELVDPCGEDGAMVVPGLVHRYPDRVLLLVNETCAVYCRYCTRSRLVGSGEHEVDLEAAYNYLEQHPEIHDVLISGGDPLVMSDAKLEKIIARLKQIPSIDLVRIGTKIPVVMPQRITDDFVAMLKKYAPMYLSIHFLHPDEITPEVEQACNKLADAGVMTFSQTVLLNGVNDTIDVMKPLMRKLVNLRVRPYYIYQCDPVQGTRHFRTRVETGIKLMEQLRGHLSGYCIPTFVIDAPGGGGKIPVGPQYVLSQNEQETVLRNYKQQEYRYVEPV
ncbi:MAG: KamA family radical SAM protein [Vampirovibrionales bacterium]|nr:KamA family radical SAM protein [Vampirovibrionales bacterium]